MSDWAVIGDGAWGDAVSRVLAKGGATVRLVGLEASRKRRPKAVTHTTDLQATLAAVERVVLAVPADALEAALVSMAPHLQGHHRLVTTTRGLTPSGMRPGEAVLDLTPVRQLAVLAGAASAEALRQSLPAALVVGSAFHGWAQEIVSVLEGERLLVYFNADPVGVELANALAAILGVAIGVARALELGAATEATALTRGMREMERLVVGLGGQPGTAFGLAGLGVLSESVFAGNGEAMTAGAALGRGDLATANAFEDLVKLTQRLVERAAAESLHAPLLQAVAGLFCGTLDPQRALGGLMQEHGARGETA